jgi:hypothetical protein
LEHQQREDLMANSNSTTSKTYNAACDDRTVASIESRAKIVRTKLRKAFPGVKFTVRARYNSMLINWRHGPSDSDVDARIKRRRQNRPHQTLQSFRGREVYGSHSLQVGVDQLELRPGR